LPGITHFWHNAFYMIFNLVNLYKEKQELYERSMRKIESLNLQSSNQEEWGQATRINYEIVLIEQGNLEGTEFRVPWVTDFSIDMSRKIIKFKDNTISLKEYEEKFYHGGIDFESHRKIIQSYGVHKS